MVELFISRNRFERIASNQNSIENKTNRFFMKEVISTNAGSQLSGRGAGGGAPENKNLVPPNFKATPGENIGSNFWLLLKEILPP